MTIVTILVNFPELTDYQTMLWLLHLTRPTPHHMYFDEIELGLPHQNICMRDWLSFSGTLGVDATVYIDLFNLAYQITLINCNCAD